jgi:hypothetical protein
MFLSQQQIVLELGIRSRLESGDLRHTRFGVGAPARLQTRFVPQTEVPARLRGSSLRASNPSPLQGDQSGHN